MAKEICGLKFYKGVGKKSGKPYEAYDIYFTEDGRPRGVEGFVAGKAYVFSNLMERSPSIGDKIDIYYDEGGYIVGVNFVK